MKFKDDYAKEGYASLHPLLRSLTESVDRFSKKFDGQEITLTDTLSTPQRDKKLKRVSLAHSEGRAVDIRTHDMSKEKLMAIMTYFNEKFINLGYLSFSGVRRLMLYKANPPHIHMCLGKDVIEQNKSKYNWQYPKHKEVKNGK